MAIFKHATLNRQNRWLSAVGTLHFVFVFFNWYFFPADFPPPFFLKKLLLFVCLNVHWSYSYCWPFGSLSCPDATEEFFEYDAEEFLVFLTLLITEGRTPEYSVKGRTEGLHCPPAQSAMPPLHKHECSDKLPQVRFISYIPARHKVIWYCTLHLKACVF